MCITVAVVGSLVMADIGTRAVLLVMRGDCLAVSVCSDGVVVGDTLVSLSCARCTWATLVVAS